MALGGLHGGSPPAQGSLALLLQIMGGQRRALVQGSPWSSLGPFLAKELSTGGLCGGVGASPFSAPGSLCQCGVAGLEHLAVLGQPVSCLLWPKCCFEPCREQEPCCHLLVCPSSCLSLLLSTQLLPGPSWGCCRCSQDLLALSQGSILLLTPSLTTLSCRREKR